MGLDILSYDFMKNAMLAGFLASLMCGVMGTFVVTKRLVFIVVESVMLPLGGLDSFLCLG